MRLIKRQFVYIELDLKRCFHHLAGVEICSTESGTISVSVSVSVRVVGEMKNE